MFDFDATLPVMALQFIILAVLLNAVFYKPIGKVLDERADYIRQNETQARETLAKTQALAQEYEKQLAEARRQSQSIVTAAQTEAKSIADGKIAEAQRQAIAEKEAAAQEIEREKQEALRTLEQQVDSLSRQILEKILGPEFV
jgi:F-type H+-transporting ATPase subunit b